MTASSFVLATLLLSLGQAPGDIVFSNQRGHSVPVNFPESRRAEIRELLLFASQDQGETWSLASKINPDQKEFVFNAPLDGTYWLRVALVDRSGRQEPENLYKVAPNQKMVIDTLKPLLRIVSAQRSGNEITVSWEAREDHPDWTTFRLEYQANPGVPTMVTATAGLTGQARFTPNTNGPVVVRMTLRDKAGNESTATAEVQGLPGAPIVAAAATSASAAPPALPQTITPRLPDMPAPPGGPLPSELTQAPLPAVQPAPPIGMPAAAPVAAPPVPAVPQVPTLPPTPPTPTEAAPFAGTAIPGNPAGRTLPPAERARPFTAERPPAPLAPVAGNRWTGTAPPPTYPTPSERPIATTESTPASAIVTAQYQAPLAPPAPRKPLPTLQYVNSPEVVLEYELSKVGPSGVGSVDIYLTQDDGQTWEHVATDPAVIGKTTGGRHQGIVELPGDGIYGFILVVRSQAQLKQDMQQLDKKAKGPRPGDVPEIRVEVDTGTPTAELFPPRRDSSKANALMLVWNAADKNLGSNPITLEWSERREGPWLAIATNIANSGKHSWQLPDRLPVQVYMRLRIRDLAGNEGVALTPEPQLVDLSGPEGRLVNVSVQPRRP